MRKFKMDIMLYLVFTILYAIIIFSFHNLNGIKFSILYYISFSCLFWMIYIFFMKAIRIKIHFLSLLCLTLLEFYFQTFYFDMFDFLGVVGIFEGALFNYVVLCFFILDLMRYFLRRKLG